MKPHNRFVEIANSSFGFLYLLLGGGGGVGGMMTTVLRRHPEQYLQNLRRAALLGVYSNFVLSEHSGL